MRSALERFFLLVLRLFFRRLEVHGAEQVPRAGPVMFVVNHPNALIDPLFLLCLAPRRVCFLAKASLFRLPLLGMLVRGFDSIPVHRRQEGGDPARTRVTFARARDQLRSGNAVAIFPEGTTHSDPQLKPLKTGAARLALGATALAKGAEEAPLSIVPVGLYFTAKGIYRSSALMLYGVPLEVPRVALGADGEPPAEEVRALTERIREALSAVTLEAEQEEALSLVARAEAIYASTPSSEEPPLVDELGRRRRFVAEYAELRRTRSARLEQLRRRLERYEAELREIGVAPREFDAARFRPATVLRYLARRVVATVLLAPGVVIGTLTHYPTYRAIGWLATRATRGQHALLSTGKAILGLLLFPLTWIAVAVALERTAGTGLALASLVVLPLSGVCAALFWEQATRFLAATRAFLLFALRRDAFDRLASEQRAIREEIDALGREVEGRHAPGQRGS
ncbi:MAG: 1-acyl-sn-glycerol-3-phosphate acyltransferase [Myxococcota bacterium]|nr:1-acyl-sn-glycerol-3-phosphate acyltransferase [Myxococcota bacterium]